MSELPPDSTSDKPEQTEAPNGWELACLGIVRSEFGRRKSDALKKAMLQLSAEKAWVEDRTKVVRVGWWRRVKEIFALQPSLRFVGVIAGAAVVFVVGAGVWTFLPSDNRVQVMVPHPSGCKISDTLNARWADSKNNQLKPGDF